MIPKTLHYCWFGNGKKPKDFEKYRASWERCLPGFEIIEWNEHNYDYRKSSYMIEAYDARKYAYVSDFARCDILNSNGGLYVDTDVEMLQVLPSSLLQEEAFGGREYTGQVNMGLIWGSERAHPFLARMLESYEGDNFEIAASWQSYYTVVQRAMDILRMEGLHEDDIEENTFGVHIFPSEVFCAYDAKRRAPRITENTISVHHYDASWLSPYEKARRTAGTLLRRVGFHG